MATDAERFAQDTGNETGYDNLLKQREAAYQDRYQRLFYQADKDRDRWRARAKMVAGMLYHVYNGGQLDRAATITAIAACDELKEPE